MNLYNLINPSDLYTFRAPNIEIAAVAVLQLSSHFGAEQVGGDERTPVLWGWDEWLTDRGIDSAWVNSHLDEVADALDSFLIGGTNERADVESMLAMLPEDNRVAWKMQRQDRHRTSMSKIGERAYEIAKAMRANVEHESHLYTDAAPAYGELSNGYFHKWVDHLSEYVRGRVHINGIENFWSLLKRMLRGTYVAVAEFHLQRYLDEQAFRFNQRDKSDAGRFQRVLRAVVGKRLTYRLLTAQGDAGFMGIK